ncbi:MAG: hypothetical protein DRR19_16875 [Candidatus Parabeggiatoa sp. nov. 1]|nr:MAG: hypothetical protein DRR19_16875 [Gammaproteobacteria bacterium]
MILVGSEKIAARALIKLITGLEDKYGQINIEQFRKQRSQIEDEAFDLTQIPVLLEEVKSIHPFIGSRIEAMYQYSPEYAKLFLTDDNYHIKLKLNYTHGYK